MRGARAGKTLRWCIGDLRDEGRLGDFRWRRFAGGGDKGAWCTAISQKVFKASIHSYSRRVKI